MSRSIRGRTEDWERQFLSKYAVAAAASAGRIRPENPDPVRTAFQRDRDRILHCKSFRRLKHKTQVFIDPKGDHYRTRLTHTLEVSQISRTVGRALNLNEDLTEAIALGHDVGHTPFGHAGESALDEAIRAGASGEAKQGFRHYEQSLRVLQELENLNLTLEVRNGIGGHSKGQSDLEATSENSPSLEAEVVRICDRIAYLNHDLDDALRSGIISEAPPWVHRIGTTSSRRIGSLVEDIIASSYGNASVSMSKSLLDSINDLKDWLFANVYLRYPALYPDVAKAKSLVKELFEHYSQEENLPPSFSGFQGAIDYVAGMTDRYAIEKFCELRMPSSWG